MDNVKIIPITKDLIQQNISCFIDIISDGIHEYWQEDEFLYDLPDKWESSLLLSYKNKIIGFIISSRKINTFHIHKFFIHKKYRSFGFGNILLQKFEERLKEKFNSHSITLKVYIENTKAIKFYRKHNFIETTIQDNLLILQKNI